AATNEATSPRTSSRISRTRATGLPFGSSSGQSSRRNPGTTGQASPQPIVTSTSAPRARSSVSRCGCTAERSIPAPPIPSTTSGWTGGPGSVPAERARALVLDPDLVLHGVAAGRVLLDERLEALGLEAGPCLHHVLRGRDLDAEVAGVDAGPRRLLHGQ